jgi:hypothetical protein
LVLAMLGGTPGGAVMISKPESTIAQTDSQAPPTCRVIDWFHEGEAKVVEVDGVRIIVRFIGRKGRRGRIAIEAPAGAVFANEGIRSM